MIRNAHETLLAVRFPYQEALLAQWLERAAVNRKVTGSIPVGSDFSGRGTLAEFARN